MRTVNIIALCHLMDTNNAVNYVTFTTPNTVGYLKQWPHRTRQELIDSALPISASVDTYTGSRLVPLNFWYDRPHLARVSYYRDLFIKVHLDPLSGPVTIKNFIEDTLGQVIRNRIKSEGWSAHREYGCYLYLMADDSIITVHLDGRRYLTNKQKATKGYKPKYATE